jgi:hypothetical protein
MLAPQHLHHSVGTKPRAQRSRARWATGIAHAAVHGHQVRAPPPGPLIGVLSTVPSSSAEIRLISARAGAHQHLPAHAEVNDQRRVRSSEQILRQPQEIAAAIENADPRTEQLGRQVGGLASARTARDGAPRNRRGSGSPHGARCAAPPTRLRGRSPPGILYWFSRAVQHVPSR